MDKNQEIEIHERVACLETTSEQTCKNVELIMTNHLPHIQASVSGVQADVSSIKNSQSWYAGAGIASITILNIIINIIIKLWN